MTDPLGLIGSQSGMHAIASRAARSESRDADLPEFKDALRAQIARVNELQQDAKEAIEDLAAGRGEDMVSVMVATQKADIAFQALLQVRNKVMEAYEEIKQIRV